ncbi:MAG: hypothetical protein ACLVAI_09295, partial [Anaerovoracaceae bacterium]
CRRFLQRTEDKTNAEVFCRNRTAEAPPGVFAGTERCIARSYRSSAGKGVVNQNELYFRAG